MIRRYTIGVLNLIILFLPPKKRKGKRVAWLQGLLYPYYENEQAFYLWRDEMIIRAKVTGEVLSLQWYLNHLYDPAQQRILIIDSNRTGTYVSLSTEATAPVRVSLQSEAGSAFRVGLTGEVTSSLPVDFRVLIPAGVNALMVAATVKLYNMARKSFDVQTL